MGIFLAVFLSAWGVLDFIALSELNQGVVLEAEVWAPVAILYSIVGFPYAILPHVFLVLIFVALAAASTKNYITLKGALGEGGLAEIKAHDKYVADSQHIVGKDWGPFKKFLSLIGAGIIVSAVFFGGVIFMASRGT